ncbi:hydroxymethylcytosylglucuronate/cytosylglucuronate synthase [Kitasatospora sp. NPDC059973]|uniref:hydroxymethylcytosylglucuronate/cytosylglucurona te synthase n=1 Tax=Kitasatospora sp. NPDC059973 TaxID=3347020 RepID=UPI003674DA42
MPSDLASHSDHHSSRSGPATVALVGAEFGWGSSGKLSAVLSALRDRPTPPLRFVGLASGLGRPLLAEHAVDAWHDLPADPGRLAPAVEEFVRSQGVRAAVVVLDGAAATALLAAGVPTVFVDSLPFLWSEGDRAALPLDATVYCAQKSVELPPECLDVLADARALRWVEAVIAAPRGPDPATGHRRAGPRRPYRRALVSLGGLRAPTLGDPEHYPRLVVPAALEALAAHGVEEVHIAGNLPAELAGRLVDESVAPPRTTTGPLGHGAFLERLADSDVLLTSPGLTTLLEAGGLRVPTVCLPPQNLSQIFNGRYHGQALGAPLRVLWPKDVLVEEEALALRSEGEDHALELIYDSIGRAALGADRPAVRHALRDGVLAALRRSTAVDDWGALTTAVGTGGAVQVADALLGVLAAPDRPV